MAFEAGTQLDQYRLVETIGEGGMGVVWKARDTSLDRDVAVKVLPESLAGDEAFLARFEREAKAVAALSHGPRMLYHMKRDTVRPQDRVDAARIREAFDLDEESS